MSNAATAQKTNGKAATEEKAVMEVVKTEPSNSAKLGEKAILSLEKRIQKVQELNIVIDKWRKLQEARKNLNEFKLGNDGMNSTIIIRDAAGREFKTSQSIVFTTVLQTVQQVLDEKIAETEVQIDFAS
jgi:N-acetylglucosamine kinase-like BadF-type ATPase